MKHTLGFDPRDIPWSVQDQSWPALPPAVLHAEHLRWVFKNPPIWTPEVKREPPIGQRAPQAAAVLVPIVMRGEQGNEPHLLLIYQNGIMMAHLLIKRLLKVLKLF